MTLDKNTSIGIAGAGAMGSGIAQIAATAGHEVQLFDKSKEALKASEEKLRMIMNRLVEKGKLDKEKADRIIGNISYTTKLEDFSDCGLVIEAIIESLDAKKSLLKTLNEEIVDKECVLATNTSSLSIAAISSAVKNPENVIGIHFFNPAPLMPLVEIIPSLVTAKDILRNSKNLIDSWGKETVIAKDTPGFIVNRVARPFYGEALRIYEEGKADFATIDWAMKEMGGFRMGPFQLMDFIGNDVNYKVTETVFREFFYDPRYKPSFTQKRLAEAGLLGRKSGKGYYDYSDENANQEPDKDEELGKDILWRILVMLINEAADALFLNIASRDHIDLAMTKGVNYPKGLLKWADEKGIKNCVKTLDHLYDEYHEDRYRCSPLLRKMAKENKSFYQ